MGEKTEEEALTEQLCWKSTSADSWCKVAKFGPEWCFIIGCKCPHVTGLNVLWGVNWLTVLWSVDGLNVLWGVNWLTVLWRVYELKTPTNLAKWFLYKLNIIIGVYIANLKNKIPWLVVLVYFLFGCLSLCLSNSHNTHACTCTHIKYLYMQHQ